MALEFLHHADVIACLKQMCSKEKSEGVTADMLDYARFADCLHDGPIAYEPPSSDLHAGAGGATGYPIGYTGFNYFCLSMSRISVRSISSFEGAGGCAGASSSFFFNVFIALIAMKMAKATIRKSKTF